MDPPVNSSDFEREASSFAALAAAARASRPLAAVVLGSGMGLAAQPFRPSHTTPFVAIPGMSSPSVSGHRGRLTLGEWAGKRVLVFEGRLHYYEGHPWRTVVLPVQTAASLGAGVLLLTNAAGGIHEALTPG